jgi:hypothetical protein
VTIQAHDRGLDLTFLLPRRIEGELGQGKEALPRMVEGNDRIKEHEDSVRHRPIAGVSIRDLLESANRVVTQITDGARGERRQLRVRHEVLRRDEALEGLERVRSRREPPSRALLNDRGPFDRETAHGSAAQKGIASDRLPSRDALEKEAFGAGTTHPRKKGDRRQGVADEGARDRHGGSRPNAGKKLGSLGGAVDHDAPPGRILRISSDEASDTPNRRAWRNACAANICRPSTVGHLAERAARIAGVGEPSRRYTQSKTSGFHSNTETGTTGGSSSFAPSGVALK